jgi:hypothetical protein
MAADHHDLILNEALDHRGVGTEHRALLRIGVRQSDQR